MKAKEVLLLILIVAAGVTFYEARTGGLWIDGDGAPFGAGRAYTYEDSMTLEGPVPPLIELRNAHGDVEVRGAATESVSLTFRKVVRRRKEAQAKAVADKLKAVVRREAGRIEISTNRSDFEKKGFETDFRLIVPEGVEIAVENSYGTVTATGLAAARIDNAHGKVDAADIAGPLSTVSTYEDVDVARVGACAISARHADVDIRQAGGDVRVDHAYGRVSVSDAAAGVIVQGSHTEASLLRIAGAVEVRTSYEKASLVDVGPATILGEHADVSAEGIGGPLKVATTYADVRARDVRGDLDVEGRSVGVVARSVAAGLIRVATSYEDLDLADFTGRVDIGVSHAAAVLAPAALDAAIEVRNAYGAIRFVWPKGARLPFEGRSKGGSVKWLLAERPDIETSNGESLLKAFSADTGGPAVTLSTSYADIVVEESPSPDSD